MVTANDLKVIMAMKPAFTTKHGDRPDSTDMIDTDAPTRENCLQSCHLRMFYRGFSYGFDSTHDDPELIEGSEFRLWRVQSSHR